jgi:hypothetical protein
VLCRKMMMEMEIKNTLKNWDRIIYKIIISCQLSYARNCSSSLSFSCCDSIVHIILFTATYFLIFTLLLHCFFSMSDSLNRLSDECRVEV